MGLFKKLRDRKGQGALEYAMILAIIVAVVVIGLRTGAFQNAVTRVTTYLAARVSQATT